VDPTPSALLERALAADPGRPLLTFYDDATGERVELSVATTANWVAKTAGLLVDGLGTAPGDRVAVDLPRHWLAAVWALAAWRTGCEVVLGALAPTGPAPGGRLSGRVSGRVSVAVTGPAGLAAAARVADEVVGVSLLPLGAPFGSGALPAGALDYAREVPGHADRFSGPAPPAGSAALRTGAGTWTQAEVVALAAGLAARWHAGPAARLLVAGRLDQPDELLATALVPLAVGGSAVLCRHRDPSDDAGLDRLAAAERVSARAVRT
jgi:uncharacterized protein (TIGR03089 family)